MKGYCLLIITLFLSLYALCQETGEEILMTIGDRPVTLSEFERIYKKNNTGDDILEKKSVEEYLELFINFKLKVIEAENLGLDTLPAFRKELKGYRNQLAKPYLTDREYSEKLIKEAYDRLKTEVNVSHILIKLPNHPSPEDTLRNYNKAIRIRQRILLGESFEAIARGASDDPSAKSNGGNLGYFTAFRMVYPFESAAYNLEVGEISMPVRTRYGYHIIKAENKRESQGKIKVAHIMIAIPRGSKPEIFKKAEEKIYDIYAKLQQGEDFSELAGNFSEDPGSAKNGGELEWFGTGRMIPEFESAAFALNKNGEISKPVKTGFGWHIIKLLDRKELESFNELKPELSIRIARDERSVLSNKSLIDKLKTEYNFKLDSTRLAEFYDAVKPAKNNLGFDINGANSFYKPLFSFANQKFNQNDFFNFIKKYTSGIEYYSANEFVNTLINDFVSGKILEYEDTQLEKKYPEFRYLIKEYHDGILLFELTDKMVWSMAVSDTIGLEKFYKDNKNSYMWEKRVDATIYTCSNDSRIQELIKMLKKQKTKGYTETYLLDYFNTTPDEKYLTIENGVFTKGDHRIVDMVNWEKGITNIPVHEGEITIIVINSVINPQPKTLDEAKGLVTSDFQNFLDENWIRELRKKYKVNVNKKLLIKIN
jgi:peptidyl-prolyl cis-trans isomerase SurA